MNELDDLKLQLTSATGLAWAEPGEDDEQDTFLIARDYVYGEVYTVIEREDNPWRGDSRDKWEPLILRARLMNAREVYLPLWRKVSAMTKTTGSNVFGVYDLPANVDYPIRQHWPLDPAGFVKMIKFGMTRYRDLYNTDWSLLPESTKLSGMGKNVILAEQNRYARLTHPVLKVQRITYRELSPDMRKRWMKLTKEAHHSYLSAYRATFAEFLPKFNTLRAETNRVTLISDALGTGVIVIQFDEGVVQLRICYIGARVSATRALLEAIEDTPFRFKLLHDEKDGNSEVRLDISCDIDRLNDLKHELTNGRLGSLVKSLYYQIIEKW